MSKKLFIFLVLLALLVGFSAAAPPKPCAFYGTVTIGGAPAPAGTEIVAKVFGTDHGKIVTTQSGKYGGPGTFDPKLEVVLTETEYTTCCQSCGCSLLIEFYANGKKAGQTWTFEEGGFKELNLTVSGVAPPTTKPTTSPTTIPPTTSRTTPVTTIPTPTPTPRPTTLPALPHSFYGTVMIGENEPAQVGTEIEARGTGVIEGPDNPVIITTPGHYGGAGPYDRRLEVQGYITTGEPLEFYIGRMRAECHDVQAGTGWTTTYPFSPGANTELNLRINVTPPIADFIANPPGGYEPLVVQFTDLSQGPPSEWLWEFGDGSTSTLQNPQHGYYNGVYTITLTVRNPAGEDSLTRTKYITVYRVSSPGGGGGGGGSSSGYYAIGPTATPTSNVTSTPTPTPTVTQGPVPPGGTLPLNSDLALSQSVVIASQDNTGIISMVAGMRPTTATGEPLLTLTIRRIPDSSVPPVPGGALFSYAGYAYEVEPSGASFDPYATLIITVSEQDWAGLQGREPLFIKWYNPSTSAWEDIPTTIDQGARTVSAKITHTSIFALFASNPPATPPTTVPTTPPPSGLFGIAWLWILAILLVIIAVIVIAFFIMRRREPPEEPPVGPGHDEDDIWKVE